MQPNEPLYVIGIEEVTWGIMLVAVSMVMHGFGMLLTLRVSHALKPTLDRAKSFVLGISSLILASWMIIIVHLLEVMVWAYFFYWKDAIPHANKSLYFYFTLNEYTTLGSNYNLDFKWRLLEGMLGTAGLLSFAWSTTVLLTLVQEFQDRHLDVLKSRGKSKATVHVESRHPPEKTR